MALLRKPRAVLALEDGTVYYGYAFGFPGRTVGEVVFNTSMTGYQEILTDPSYHGQIVTMTYPHIGNYGVSVYDMESNRPYARGFIVREFSRVSSNHRAHQDLPSFMEPARIVGIEGIDTRALTRRLRTGGVVKGVIHHGEADAALEAELVAQARAHEDIDGRDMTPEVTTPLPYARPTFRDNPRVVVIDFGIKHSIVYKLEQAGAEVIVVPAQTTPAQIMALDPYGLVLSNGPGDPAGRSTPTTPCGSCSGCCRPTASAWGTSCSAWRSAAAPTSSSTATTAPTRRSRTSSPARSRSPARTTTTRSTSTRSRAAVRRHAHQPQRRHARGDGAPALPGVQRAVPPRGEPGSARRELPVPALHRRGQRLRGRHRRAGGAIAGPASAAAVGRHGAAAASAFGGVEPQRDGAVVDELDVHRASEGAGGDRQARGRRRSASAR
jgi:hypothetical protein